MFSGERLSTSRHDASVLAQTRAKLSLLTCFVSEAYKSMVLLLCRRGRMKFRSGIPSASTKALCNVSVVCIFASSLYFLLERDN